MLGRGDGETNLRRMKTSFDIFGKETGAEARSVLGLFCEDAVPAWKRWPLAQGSSGLLWEGAVGVESKRLWTCPPDSPRWTA